MSQQRDPGCLTYVLLCVDVEPDDFTFQPSRPSPWSAFEYLSSYMSELRLRLEELTQDAVRYCWGLRMDPQIKVGYGSTLFVAERFGSQLDQFVAQGDAIGVHPHDWRWDERRGSWISDHGDQGWVEECLLSSVLAYREAFKVTPAFHRFGAQFMNTATMNLVRDLGLPVDLTLEPGVPSREPGEYLGGTRTGYAGGFADVPRTPYHPSRDDYRCPGADPGDSFWVVPLSSGRFSEPVNHLKRTWERASHPRRSATRIVDRIARKNAVDDRDANPHPLSMYEECSPRAFWDGAFATGSSLEAGYLAFPVRTDPGSCRRFEDLVQHLLTDRRARSLRFVTPGDIVPNATLGLRSEPI